jgi:nucleoside-diphosphate-sugar epimerase
VVRRLVAAGRQVIAVDLDSPAMRSVAQTLGAQFMPADIASTDAIRAVLARTGPHAVIHLAAIIPPTAYRRPELASRVNVTGTANLVAAASALRRPPRLIFASSTAVYGSRNGAKDLGLCSADTQVRPRDIYGAHKLAAEQIVRSSGLGWSILRIGGILASALVRRTDRDSVLLDAIIPSDNRIHTVSVGEAAEAFANAADADCLGMTLLIGGDESHMLRQHELARRMMAVAGLGDRAGDWGRRCGDPGDDDAWFVTDWLDTSSARTVLGFRAVPLPQCMSEFRAELSRGRALLRPLGLVAPLLQSLTSPYRRVPGQYADPWGVVARRFGELALNHRP